MRYLYSNKNGISNVLGYLLSFAIASIVMVSAVIITSGIINNRTAAVAELQAQSIANKVADAIVEAVTVDQSMPEGDYTKTMDIPLDIAGRQYYIDITDAAVYVNTTDGVVSKSAPTYGAGSSKTGISSDTIYSGGGEIEISLERSDVIYKFDFGTGNNTRHSPVESGYYMVSNTSSAILEELNPPWWNQSYPCRIPIKVENNAMHDVDEATVKLVLNPSNFDYSLANVTVISPSIVSSNLVFVDTHFSVVADIEVNHDIWYTWWANRETDDDVEIRITELSEGYGVGDIQANTVKLNGYLSWETWEGSSTLHFDPNAALESISSSGESSFEYPSPGDYTVTISGLLDDGSSFSGRKVITVADGDILVDKDFDEHTPGWEYTHFNAIRNAISAASTGDTIYVYNGIYYENIEIDEQIRLFGEDRMDTIIDGSGGGDDAVTVTANNVYIDSFTVRGGSGSNGKGIYLDGDTDDYRTGITIRNCEVYNNSRDGIQFYKATENTIINCEIYWNGNYTARNGICLIMSSYNNIINCNVHHQEGGDIGDEYPDGIDLRSNSDHNLIENCSVHNMTDDGIDFDDVCDNNTVRNCSIRNNGARGIQLQQEYGHNTITNCDIYSNSLGIAVYSSSFNTISNCKIHNNINHGIMLTGDLSPVDASDYNTISNCEIYGNGGDGIFFWLAARSNTVSHCDIHHNAYDTGNGGIELEGIISVNNNTIEYCDIHDNTKADPGSDGIGFVGSVWNTVRYCNIYNNNWGACVTASGLNNRFEWCKFYGNTKAGGAGGHGIYLEGFSNTNFITNCDSYFNEGDGLSFNWGSLLNIVTSCNFFDNTGDGVHMEGHFGIAPPWPIADNQIGYCNIFGNDIGVNLTRGGGTLSIGNVIYHNNIEFNDDEEGYVDIGGFQWDTGITHPSLPSRTGNWWGDYDVRNSSGVWIGFTWYPNVYEVAPDPEPLVIDRYPANYENSWNNGERCESDYLQTPSKDQRMFIQVAKGRISTWYDYYHVLTITEALSHVTDYGTIYIHDSPMGPTYYKEAFTINKEGITIIGASRDGVVIDGTDEPSGNLITVDRDNVDIRSLTIYNGKTSGIYINHNDHINITDCTIYSERNDNPGACIRIRGASPSEITIENCEIYSNGENDYGIRIYEDADGVKIIDCEIYGHGMYGIYLYDEVDDTNITNCDIYSNQKSGIYIKDDTSDNNNITNCEIHDNVDHGIYLDHADLTNIANCYIRDNGGHGVYIYDHADENTITNTFTYDNELSGIYLSNSHDNDFTNCGFYNDGGSKQDYGIYLTTASTGNDITDCYVYSNDQHGICIDGQSEQNNIIDCQIYNNAQGIYITGNSGDNHITTCEIQDNTHGIYIRDSDGNFVESNTYIHKNGHGIYIIDNADGNIITNCDIYDNNYGINISGSSCTSNKIYYNNFKNCTPFDGGSNQWDSDDYQTGGNHWDDYDEGWEGAYDFYTGFDQDIPGSDGKVDTPRNIPGADPENRDRWPLGGGRYDVRPYYIDYWNPYGESVILVKMNLKSQTSNYLYLYYGYDKPLTEIHNHTIDEVSVFSDDFESDLNNWTLSEVVGYGITSGDIEGNITDGCLNLTSKEFIITNDDCIPEIGDPAEGQPPSVTTNESTYVVEARMKLKEGQGNMMVLGYYSYPWPYSFESRRYYLVSANRTPNTNLSIYKYKYIKLPFVPGNEETYHLTESTALDVTGWLRMKSYVYTGKTCYKPDLGTPHDEDVARISSYLYNFDTFADEGSISAVDTYWYKEGDKGEPDEEAENGEPYMNGKIGLGCGLMSSEGSRILVDWVRVMKTPAVAPTITIGAPESVNYGWGSIDYIKAKNIITFNPFTPGPELRDFNYGTDSGTFKINLPADDYVITIMMGNHSGICNATTIQYPGGMLTIPETKRGKFETKWFPIQHDGEDDLQITFGAEAGEIWTVNSLVVEKGGKGIRVGAG